MPLTKNSEYPLVDAMYNLIVGSGILLCILFIAVAVFYPYIDSRTAINVLRNNGYSDISIVGNQNTDCKQWEIYHTKFTAISSNGEQTIGVICSGSGTTFSIHIISKGPNAF